ncbi:hypothetical protein H0O02_03890, partial [Candidatus Micrarchaeota archaeon]|nr:hypothetical protein [Candidatus Micrarchaeota archaeon]
MIEGRSNKKTNGSLGDVSYLLKPKAVFNTLKYFMETEPGSIPFLRTVASKQPKISEGQYIADLHAHPYISHDKTREDLFHTFHAMVKNNVEVLAVTVHGNGNPREMDFWEIKDF